MIISTPPSRVLYFAMTVVSVAAGAMYVHEYFYIESTTKNLVVALAWSVMAVVWMHSLFQNRGKETPAEAATAAAPESPPEVEPQPEAPEPPPEGETQPTDEAG